MGGQQTFSDLSRTILIDGDFRKSDATNGRDVIDPATENVLTEIAETSASEVDAAVDSGHAAQKIWWRMSGLERAEIMHEIANDLQWQYRNDLWISRNLSAFRSACAARPMAIWIWAPLRPRPGPRVPRARKKRRSCLSG